MVDPPNRGAARAALVLLVLALVAILAWSLSGGSDATDVIDAGDVARTETGEEALSGVTQAPLADVDGSGDSTRRGLGSGSDSVRLRGPGKLVGTVVERGTRAGVAGAEVRLLPVPPVGMDVVAHVAQLVGVKDEFQPRVQPVATATSGPDGSFAFEGIREGRWYVEARATYHVLDAPVAARVVASGSGGPVDVWMRPGGRVLGRVIDADGGPASGARVALTTGAMRFLEAAADGEVAMMRTRADEDGAFEFPAVAPAEGYEVAAIGEGLGITHVLDITVRAGEDTVVVVDGDANATIRGRVVTRTSLDSDDVVPLEGAMVAALPRGLRHMKLAKELLIATHVVTGADGTYELKTASAGTVDVLAMAEGHLPARGPVVRIAPGGDREAPDFVLERGPMVRGRVVDGAGAPVEGARVLWSVIDVLEVEGRPSLAPLFVAGMREFAYPVTDPDGRFVAGPFTPSDGRDGSFTLRVLKPGYESARVEWSPSPSEAAIDGAREPGRLAELTIVLHEGGSISGRVVDADTGEPVERFSVRITDRIETGTSEPSRYSPFGGELLVEDSLGRFVIESVESGPQTLSIESDEHRPFSTEVRVPVGGALQDLVLALERGATIRGVVVDSGGEPVEGAQVTTDAQVISTFDRLEEQRLVIEDGLAVRNRGRQITPPSGLLRHIAALGLMGEDVVTTGVDGTFVLRGLEPGTQEVLAFHRDYCSGARLVEAAPEAPGAEVEPVTVVLTEGGGLRGKVTDRFGQPVEGATVLAFSPGLGADMSSMGLRGGPGFVPVPAAGAPREGSNGGYHQARSRTDGTYEIKNMDGGAYFLVATRGDESLTVMSFLGTLNFQLVHVPPDRVVTKNLVDTSASACRVHGRVLSKGAPRADGILLALNLEAEGFLGVDFKAAPVENDGTYEFAGLAPGEYQVTFEARGIRSSFYLDVPDASEMAHDIHLPEGTISATLVERETREPISGATVVLTPLDQIDGPGILAQLFASEAGVVRRSTDDEGRFEFDGLAEGEYRVSVERAARGRGAERVVYAPIDPLDVSVDEDEDVALGEIELDPGVTLRGAVRDERGEPITGAQIVATSSDPGTRPRRAESRDEGAFRVDGLGVGTWRVTATAPGFATGRAAPITIEEGDRSSSLAELELRLERGVVVTVHAVDGSGRSLAGVACALQPKGDPAEAVQVDPGDFFQRFFTGAATTDGDGLMELGRYAGGAYTLRASMGARTTELDVELDGAEGERTIEVTLE